MTQSSLVSTTSESSDSTLLPAGEQFLRFQLVPSKVALLPLTQLAEVLTIPVGQITPIPQLSHWMMGVYNWRGEALWMVDLAHLVGLTPWHQQAISTTYTAVVLRTGEADTLVMHAADQAIGLVINRAEAIERCDPDRLQSPSGAADPRLVPFLRGYYRPTEGDQLAVFDDKIIISAICGNR